MSYVYKTIKGCKRQILFTLERIDYLKESRGKEGVGTFYLDLQAVDKCIASYWADIYILKNRILELSQNPALIKELKSSEIF